jgi:DNA-binding LacI/PurR family transcriptional regulator
MANIKDIARMSGVAPSTVSAVLTGKTERVKPATRERIIEVMRELRYTPSPMFYGNKGVETKTLGVVMFSGKYEEAGELEEYYLSIVSGISAVALHRGSNVMLVPTHAWDNTVRSLRVYFDGRCDALLLVNPKGNEPIIDALKERDYPFVLVNSEIDDGACNYVGIDLYAGATMAMEHLLELGHRKVAFLAGNGARYRPREEAYVNALTSRDLPVRAEWMPSGDYFAESGRERTIRMMTECSEKPTAIFCETDPIALGALAGLEEIGLSVPGDVSVIGFDDVSAASASHPSLTTIRRPLTKIGGEAARTALQLLQDGPRSGIRREFPAELVVRETTAGAVVDKEVQS